MAKADALEKLKDAAREIDYAGYVFCDQLAETVKGLRGFSTAMAYMLESTSLDLTEDDDGRGES